MNPTIRFNYLDSSGYCLATELPDACIDDCSGQGSVDDAVAYWAGRFEWDVSHPKLSAYLKTFGCWDREELLDYDQNIKRLLWSMCCDLKEDSHQRVTN